MKTTIKKILVPVDFTETAETAVKQAMIIAGLTNAVVYLIHVIEYNSYLFTLDSTQIVLPTIQQMESDVKKKMNELQQRIEREYELSPNVYVTSGNIVTEIIVYSQSEKIDLIIMGTHGASGYKEFFIGSNAQGVVTLSEIPVMTMQNKSDKLIVKKILLPIDNSRHSREKVNIAIEIAELFHSEIHILGLPDLHEKKELDKFRIKMESVEKLIKASGLTYSSQTIEAENVAREALDYSKQRGYDLIVINTGHESKITGIFLGPFAQQIVNHSSIPVLSIKPKKGRYIITTPGYGID